MACPGTNHKTAQSHNENLLASSLMGRFVMVICAILKMNRNRITLFFFRIALTTSSIWFGFIWVCLASHPPRTAVLDNLKTTNRSRPALEQAQATPN